ncbi:DNA glycosylase AlkZ-like family protein [Nonomuraea cypriaca]|uniref:DNA glycosylase AlkZ-like family protein n=1 Tax=Nonomuraea cypriaca TaxID=1187855 RepID=UPI001A9C576D|nr:crosslink repair DNA glycosylase YcaQ family protein [Nonomuraea cypriaca]
MDQQQIAAFRLGAHHLADRLPEGSLQRAAGACAIQNSPPGSALLALHARVAGVRADQVARAVEEDKILLQTWCMRGAPFLFPTEDAAVFTTGLLPDGAAGRRHFVFGVKQALARLDMSLDEAVSRTEAELDAVLPGRRLDIGELGVRLSERIESKLPPAQAEAWRAEGPYAPGAPLGEGVVHFVIRILALKGTVCFAPRSGNKAPFVLTSEWLGTNAPAADRTTDRTDAPAADRTTARTDTSAADRTADRDAARAELARRFLRCYGPATPEQFATWTGLSPEDARRWWRLVADELAEVDLGRRTGWVLAADLDALRSPGAVEGVRFVAAA